MNKVITGTVCAGLFAMGLAASATAATINVNFDGFGNSIDYTFTTSFDGGEWSGVLDSATFNVGPSSTTYSSSNYTLQMGFISEVDTFEIYDGNTLVSQMVFDGNASITDGNFGGLGGIFEMLYYGDQNTYSAANYEFSSPVDGGPMLYVSGGPTPFGDLQMTHVSVATVPVPAAAWLFLSGMTGLVGIARRRA